MVGILGLLDYAKEQKVAKLSTLMKHHSKQAKTTRKIKGSSSAKDKGALVMN